MYQQFIINGLLTSSITALVGVGYLLIYRTGRFFHFAHGIIFAWGAYLLSFFLSQFPSNHWVIIFVSILSISTLGIILEVSTYNPLRNRKASGVALLIAGLGLYIILQNIISLTFGDDTLSFRWWKIQAGWEVLNFRITPVQFITIIVSWMVITVTWIFSKYSKVGLKMEAVSSNPELANIVGINLKYVYFWAMGLGSALGGLGGILMACDVDMTPTMGMQPLMMGVVSVIIGGNTLWGTACGAILLGMTQHIAIIWLPIRWQYAIVFMVLILFLLFRPQGFFGEKSRAESV